MIPRYSIRSPDREPVTITNRGRPVAVLSPLPSDEEKTLIGVLRGSVLGYDDPFRPATEASDWFATR